ncbi:Vacuolar protein sorting-associated protein 11 [Phlyctochytrium planicorne]|nr:Vacuolar protein sorting-associated protein 11 [Phlyctochytrium planicorne]
MAAGGIAQWRVFNFFEKEMVVDAEDNSLGPSWLQGMDVTASAGGRGSLFFGDSKGNISLVNHSLSLLFMFQAHNGPITHMKMMKNRNILVSIGDDETGVPVVKVWNLDKIDKTNRTPMLARQTKVQHGNKVFPVTAFAVLENMSQIAVGLENGVVLLIRGDMSRDRFAKVKVVHESSEIVTGLGFHEDVRSTSLYIVTLARVLICPTSTKEITATLDDHGAELNCSVSTLQDHGQHMLIGRKEAVYFYGPDGRGPCFIIESSKVFVTWFRNYLVIVSREEPLPVTSTLELERSTPRGSLQSVHTHSDDKEELGTILTVYDLKTKCIAFKGTFGGEGRSSVSSPKRVTDPPSKPVPIKCVTSEWGELFVITTDNKMYRLDEKDLSTKLSILFQKNLYNLAILLVTPSPPNLPFLEDSKTVSAASTTSASDTYDHSTLIEVHKRYADYLYSKNDFDGATTQYMHTIGSLEPSYVIRKFLDAQRIHNLTGYLQGLHDKGLANEDHTTLLINCYTKQKDMARLDVFIKGSGGDASFDVETAMRVCRQAGYFDHALWLAKKFGKHMQCLQILVEDLKRFEEAVEYVGSLDPLEQETELKRYGFVLVTELPEETTKVLVRLCTSGIVVTGPKRRSVGGGRLRAMASFSIDDESEGTHAGEGGEATPLLYLKAEDFLHLYVNRPDWCVRFLERVLEARWGISFDIKGKGVVGKEFSGREATSEEGEDQGSLEAICNTVLELLVGPLGGTQTLADDNVGDSTPTPRTAEKKAAAALTAALVETFLGTKDEREAKALKLLTHPKAKYDLDQALVICYSNQFREGTLYLYEKLERYSDIVRYHIDADDHTSVVSACKKYGEIDSNLWPQALTFFADRGTGIAGRTEAQSNLTEVLDAIDRKNLMPPLKVLEILGRNSGVTVGMVRDYVVRRMEKERREVEESQKITESYRLETTQMRNDITLLQTQPTVFQSSKCSMCAQPLDLPSVHFMCKHSYHARCLGEGGVRGGTGESECPRCATENRVIMEMRGRRFSEAGGGHEVFLEKLEEKSKDRFSVIAEYFGKRVFEAGGRQEAAEALIFFLLSKNMPPATTTTASPTEEEEEEFKVVIDTDASNLPTSASSSTLDAINVAPTSVPHRSVTASPTSDSMPSDSDVAGGVRKRRKMKGLTKDHLQKSGQMVGNAGKVVGKGLGKGFKKTSGAVGSILEDFANFLRQGSVVDLAVGLVLGGAFTTLINSVVTDLVAPIIGLAISVNLQNAFIVLKCGSNATNTDCRAGSQSNYGTITQAAQDGAVTFNWGNFIQVCINVFIISMVVFMLVKVYAATFLRKHGGGKRKPCPRCDEEVSVNAHVCKWCAHEFDMSNHHHGSSKPKFPAIPLSFKIGGKKKSMSGQGAETAEEEDVQTVVAKGEKDEKAVAKGEEVVKG